MSIVTTTALKTPAITAGAYSANDALGDKITFFDGNLESGVIQSLTLVDLASQRAEIDLVLFHTDFTATADTDAFDPSDADLANCVGVISITADDYKAFADSAVACVRNIGLIYKTGTLYGQLVTRSTPTYASVSDIKLTLGILLG